MFVALVPLARAQRQMEWLDRSVVAIHAGSGIVYVSWRLIGTDPEDTGFNVYRVTGSGQPSRLTTRPLTRTTDFTDHLSDLSTPVSYFVRPVIRGKEQSPSSSYRLDPERPYLSIPLQTPAGYTPNDGSAGDLDGDGRYEIVVHQVGRGRDNSQRGQTDPPILQAYRLDGTLLWTINLGINIREGAHYTQFIVYDLDGDGRAELACKTADGTTDGTGRVLGDPQADHRNEDGYILAGPEYLTIFDGRTGAALATEAYIPPRHPSSLTPGTDELMAIWGDGYGNRVDRFLAGVAYLDGRRPSLIMARGYYTRAVIAAWNWRAGKLTNVWTFDSDSGDNQAYRGEGNHNLGVGDVDHDGKDEIIYGAAAIDDNGRGLYATGLGHGDALHFSDLDPERPGLEVFNIQERFDDAGANMRDAATGQILWKLASVKAGPDGEGPGRGNAFNIDPRFPGAECWVAGGGIEGLYDARGRKISDRKPVSVNFGIWWDGDLERELLDRNSISKWDWQNGTQRPLLTDTTCTSNNGSKATPVLTADLVGDWREEVIWRTRDNRELRLYTTTIPAERRLVTLMHDPVYRIGVAWQNVAYNQPPHTSYFVGTNMAAPPRPDIYTPNNTSSQVTP